jgi:hypothetical protein
MSKPLFADSWYETPRVTELRQEIQNLYAQVFEPYKLCFLEDATLVVLTEDESIDVANATQDGDGTVTFQKNGSSITTRTNFTLNDRLSVVCTGATTTTTVRIPRYVI